MQIMLEATSDKIELFSTPGRPNYSAVTHSRWSTVSIDGRMTQQTRQYVINTQNKLSTPSIDGWLTLQTCHYVTA